jgi:hypothetical protein
VGKRIIMVNFLLARIPFLSLFTKNNCSTLPDLFISFMVDIVAWWVGIVILNCEGREAVINLSRKFFSECRQKINNFVWICDL